MKKSGIILGLVTGVFASWIYFNQYSLLKSSTDPISNFPMFELLTLSQQTVSETNWHCGSEITNRSVAAVLASLLISNSQYQMNKLNASCESVNLSCSIGFSNCTTWKSSECGSRTLNFKISQSGEIIVDSFICLDQP